MPPLKQGFYNLMVGSKNLISMRNVVKSCQKGHWPGENLAAGDTDEYPALLYLQSQDNELFFPFFCIKMK